MPPPRLTPAQRTFGIGVTPTYDIFRPPEGMELDPAYSPVTRQQQAAVMNQDLQREAFRQARDEQQYANEERMAGRQIQAAEQQAIEAMRGKSPEEIPNILAQFPELARSKNLGGFTNFAQAVTPSAGQRTLAPSLRAKLPPAAIPHFNKRYAETGDALDSNEYAQRALDHEKFVADVLPDVMAGGGTMEDLQKIRDQIDLGPIERAAFRESWKRRGTGGVKDDHRAEAMKDSIRSMYEALPDTDDAGKPLGIDEILRQRAEIADKAYRTFYPEKFKQEAVAQPVATGGQAVPVATNAPAIRQAIPDDGTGAFAGIISNPNIPEAERNEAFTKLKTLIESSTPPKGSTFTDVDKFKKGIQERLDAAKVDLNASRFANTVAPIWTKEKDIVGKAINRMAQDLGVEEDVIIASIFPAAQNGKPALPQKIPMSIVPKEMQPRQRNKFGEREMYAKDLLAAYLADQRGKNPADASYEKDAKMKIEDLSGWLEQAEKDSLPGNEIYIKALKKVGMDTDRTQEDVIREYIKSKFQPATAPKAANSPQPPVAKIKSVKQIE